MTRIFLFIILILSTINANAKNKIVISSSSSNTLYPGAVKLINVAIVNFTNSMSITNTNVSAVLGVSIKKDGDIYASDSVDILKGTGSLSLVLYYSGNYEITFYDSRDVSVNEKFSSTNTQLTIYKADSIYSGKVFINEIMYDTPIQSEQRWIEIYTTTNIDLMNFYFLRGTSKNRYGYHLSATSRIITNNIYAVITPSKSYFERYYPFFTEGIGNYENGKLVEGKKEAPSFPLDSKCGDITPSTSSTFLSSSGGLVMLIDSSGKLVDFAVYDKTYGGSDNVSQERVSINSSSIDKDTWRSSVSPYGCTPGKVNSVAVNNVNEDFSKNNIFISKNPFNPDTETTKISFNIDRNANVEISLYDITGRYLFNINKTDNVSKDTTISYVFNGKKLDGSPLLPGMYIVYLKMVDTDTGEIIKHGKILVVSTELK